MNNENSSKLQKQRPGVFYKKGILKNFTKFTGKHLCQSLFLNKVAGLRPVTLFKKTLAQVFSCEFCEIFKTPFLIEYLWWLLLLFRNLRNFDFQTQRSLSFEIAVLMVCG